MYHENERPQVQWDGSTYSTTGYRVEDIPAAPAPQPKPKKKRGVLRAIALVLCCTLAGGGAGVGGAALYLHMNPPAAGSNTIIHENNSVPTSPVHVKQADGLTPMSLTEIYEAYAETSVVITAQTPYSTSTWYGPASGVQTSAGSGFVISDNGYIVTNYHVIDGAQTITVTMFDGTEYKADYVGGEKDNDIAVLKIDATGLKTVVLGDSDTLQVGQTVCTIGNALGSLSFSQTSGAVSGVGRAVTYSDGTVINMIQTDCTINSGNSGGPLFDSYGRVVGITSAKYSNNNDSSGQAAIENIGFAIPINDVKGMITDIMENGYVIRPYMGITVAPISGDNAQIFGWPNGVYVNSVEDGSCAQAAGIRRGDIITSLGGTEVDSTAELTAAKNRFKPGDTAEVTVYRAGEYFTLTITFDSSGDPTQDSGSSGAQNGQNGQDSQNGQGGWDRNSQGSWNFNDIYNGFFGG